ncbi:MAG: DNA polymerase III subunit delta [Erysipelotrichaceae bacterium]|nr:DNA polymerase III subunit delta [Erysipelotrichaceae bacterium]
MIYIIQGQEEIFIREKIDEIVKQSDAEVFRFDGSDKEFSIDQMLEACEGNSLFSDASVVLVNEPYFLIRKADEKDLQGLLRYVSDPLYQTQLIFYTYQNNFNSKLKVYKQIAENAQVLNLNSYDYKNFNSYVRSRINEEKLDINNEAIYLLSNLCKRNATLLNQNLEILKLYPGKIDPKVVSSLCTASDDNDSFEMINALTARDVTKALSVERKLLKENDSVLGVIGLLANQLRFLYYISYLVSKGKKRNEIMEIASISDYRLNKAMESLNGLKKEEIMYMLALLSELDISCKSDNSISDQLRFEMFILEFLRKGRYAQKQ